MKHITISKMLSHAASHHLHEVTSKFFMCLMEISKVDRVLSRYRSVSRKRQADMNDMGMKRGATANVTNRQIQNKDVSWAMQVHEQRTLCNTERVKRWLSWNSMSDVQHFTSAVYLCVRDTHLSPPTTGKSRCFMCRDSWYPTSARPPTTERLQCVQTLMARSTSSSVVTDKSRYHTFHFPHVRSRPKLCWLDIVKRHRVTSRCGRRSDKGKV